MKRLSRIGVLSSAYMGAAIMSFWGVIYLFMTMILLIVSGRGTMGIDVGGLLIVIIYPVAGFIGGAISAIIYNVMATFIGGVELRLE